MRFVLRKVSVYRLILTLTCVTVIFLICKRYHLYYNGYASSFRLMHQQQDGIYNGKSNDRGNVLLLPTDAVIDSMDDDRLLETYWKYINTLQVLCRNQTRFGSMEDGGNEVCVDDLYQPKHPCLVYSFGSTFLFALEKALIDCFNCEVHTFNPSKLLNQQKTIPGGINFHVVGLSNRTYTTQEKWKMETLSSLRNSLNHAHRVIDILKIDIEGREWTALPEIVSSGILKNVKQISIKIHFGYKKWYYNQWEYVSPKDQLKTLRLLYDEGFHMFMHEHNLDALIDSKIPSINGITAVNVISLINTRTQLLKALSTE